MDESPLATKSALHEKDKPPTTTTTAETTILKTRTTEMDKSILPTATMDCKQPITSTTSGSSKTLKRCLSVPIIHSVQSSTSSTRIGNRGTVTTRSATAIKNALSNAAISSGDALLETPKKECQGNSAKNSVFLNSMHIGIPRSNPPSREVSPAPVFNIFAPRARRYSASYSPLGTATNGSSALGSNGAPLCLTPRVSQLRQEECVDMNSREVNHEREVHTAMQMSQSWEDLTLVAENWSCKSDEFSNPLQVVLPSSGASGCSSPSPTSTRAGLRLPYGLSPSPTRRTFATRRSMSPIAMRPSQLGAVKRKFEMDEPNSGTQGNWNVYSPPPQKKIFLESRGSSPSSVCPSPDSGTYDGRMTPKLFISKLCTTNTSSNNSTNSSCSLGSSISSSSSSTGISSGGSEPMICVSSIDEGISGSESEDKNSQGIMTPMHGSSVQSLYSSSADMQDEATIMDDTKSETSSIGGCSSISLESASWDSGARTAPSFLSQLATTTIGSDDLIVSSSNIPANAGLSHKNFFINKPIGTTGTKKYVVNHDNMPNSNNCSEPSTPDNISVSSSSSGGTLLNIVPQMDVSNDITSSTTENLNNAIPIGDGVAVERI